jgi:hypothetical protein
MRKVLSLVCALSLMGSVALVHAAGGTDGKTSGSTASKAPGKTATTDTTKTERRHHKGGKKGK